MESPPAVDDVKAEPKESAERRPDPRTKPSPYEKKLLWVQLAGVVVLTLYTVFAGAQWMAIRRQAEISEKALTVADRAWMKVNPEMQSVKFTPSGAAFSYRLAISNIGRSVALNVRAAAIVVLKEGAVDEEQAAECDELRQMAHVPMLQGSIAFPGDPPLASLGVSFVNMRDIDAQARPLPGGGWQGRYFTAFLVGCGVYQLPNSAEIHTTRFSFKIVRSLRESSLRPFFIEVGKDSQAPEVFLYEAWGNTAD